MTAILQSRPPVPSILLAALNDPQQVAEFMRCARNPMLKKLEVLGMAFPDRLPWLNDSTSFAIGALWDDSAKPGTPAQSTGYLTDACGYLTVTNSVTGVPTATGFRRLSTGGVDRDGNVRFVCLDLDVGHGNGADCYATTEEALASAESIRAFVNGAAELRYSRRGKGISLRIPVTPGTCDATEYRCVCKKHCHRLNPECLCSNAKRQRQPAVAMASFIAAQTRVKRDLAVEKNQRLCIYAEDTEGQGHTLIKAAVGTWTPPPEALVIPSAVPVELPASFNPFSTEERMAQAQQATDKLAPAVSGQGGDRATFGRVCRIVQGFDLSTDQAIDILRPWNVRCTPPWSDADLLHKIECAQKSTPPDGKARGYLLKSKKSKSEVGYADLADEFLEEYPSLLIQSGDPYIFNGTRYVPWAHDDERKSGEILRGKILGFIRDHHRDQAEKKAAAEVEALLHHDCARYGLQNNSWLGENPIHAKRVIAFNNTLLDVDKLFAGDPNACTQPTPEFFTKSVRNYAFDPAAECPRFKSFIDQILPDPEVQGVTQELFGLLQIFNTDMQVFGLFTGGGNNGKGTLFNSLKALLGEDSFEALKLQSLDPRRTQLLDPLQDKLASITTEDFAPTREQEEMLKQLVCGEALTRDRKYLKGRKFECQARFVFSANDDICFHDSSLGMQRRAVIIRCAVEISEEQRVTAMSRPDYWDDERSGIMNWSLIGLKRLLARGKFDLPALCRVAAKDAVVSGNRALEFIEENYAPVANAWVSTVDLIKTFKLWAENRGYDPKLTESGLARLLKRLWKGMESTRRQVEGEQRRGYPLGNKPPDSKSAPALAPISAAAICQSSPTV